MAAPDPPLTNIASHLVRVAAERPRATAVHVLADGSSLSYDELHRDSDRIARGLARRGIGRGARVCVFVPPGRDFLGLVFALFKAGAVPVVVDPGMGVRAVGHCLAVARPQAFVGVGKAHLARRLFRWGGPGITVRIVCGGFPGRLLGAGCASLDAVRESGGDGPFEMPDVAPDETAAVLFTSGSTGPPKGAVYMHRTFAAQVTMLRDLYDVRPGEVDLATFPLFALLDPALGMTTVVPVTDPRRILGPVREHGVTHMFANPALLERIVDGAPEGTRLPTLRRVVSAGAPVRPDVLRRMQALLAEGAEVHTPYGATEALPVCSIGSREILAETAARTERGEGFCVGRPVPRMDVRVIRVADGPLAAWSDDLLAPPGEVGEIVVRGPTVTREYFDRPEATRAAKIPDGPDGSGDVWHRMGDLGRFDEHGRLWFCGRASHRVETAAGTLHSVCVEAPFDAHPAVRRTALVGVGERGAVRPVLCGGLAGSDVLTEEIEAGLRRIAATHEHTREVATFLPHPGFPVDARHNAKIRREVLRDWAAAKLRSLGR